MHLQTYTECNGKKCVWEKEDSYSGWSRQKNQPTVLSLSLTVSEWFILKFYQTTVEPLPTRQSICTVNRQSLSKSGLK